MVALPSVPAVLQLAFAVVNSDTDYMNINRLHFHYTGTAPTSGELDSFATTALTAYASAFTPYMSNTKTVDHIVAIDLTSPTAATAEVASATIGVLAGAPLPDDVALVLSLTVGRRYRGGHPRSYLPVGDSSKLSDGANWNTGFKNDVETAAGGMVTAINGAGWSGAGTISPVNVSYYQGSHLVTYPSGRHRDVPTLRGGGPIVDPVVGLVARQALGTQRRRLAR